MSKRRPAIVPRVANRTDTAGYLGRSVTWFNGNLPRLYAGGFPRPLPLLDQWDLRAVDRWLDRMGGNALPAEQDDEDAWLQAANG